MGVRINKAIGWAMPYPEDPIDRDGEAANLRLAHHAAWLLAKAAETEDEWLRDELAFCGSTLRGRAETTLGDCALWTEVLDGGTLIILPAASAKSWHRRDDDMDYAFAKDDTSSIEYPDWGFHPYGGLWMDADTGENLNQHATTLMRIKQRGGPAEVESEGVDRLARIVRPKGATSPGPYGSWAEAVERIVPLVPHEVRWVAEHLGLFTNPRDVLQLRPARAVWWE